MKVMIDIPDWVFESGRMIRVFAGIEEVMRKEDGKDWMIKVGRCSQCGKCCSEQLPQNWDVKEDGSCIHLDHDGDTFVCKLGSSRPMNCSTFDGIEFNIEGCTVKWQVM